MAIFLPDHIEYLRSIDRNDRAALVGTLVLYVFGGCQQSDIRVLLEKRKLDFDFLKWRLHLRKNGVFLRDGKLYTYAKYAGHILNPKSLDLSNLDYYLLDLALCHRPLRSHLRSLIKAKDRPAMTVRKFDKFVAEVLQSDDLVVYTRKFINRKMKFIIQSYGRDLDEIESMLLANALYGLQRAYPNLENIGHGIAIAKTLVKNTGKNFIQEVTTKKSNELIHDKDTNTYTKTTVSLDSMADGTGQFLTADGTFVHRSLLVVGINGANAVNSIAWDTLHALRELRNSPLLKRKQREFLSLMVGTPNEEFSEYIGMQNDDALENIPYAAYTKKVCAFLGVPIDAAVEFLRNLKPQLGGNEL